MSNLENGSGQATEGQTGGAAAQAAPAAPAATSQAGAGATATSWTEGFSEELKGYVQNKGFKDPAAVLDSYRNYEKLMGVPKERLVKLPEKEDDAAAWGEIYNRLGRPEKADDYKVEAFGGEKDGEVIKWAKGAFHEMGLTRKQAEGFSQKLNEYVAKTMEAEKVQVEAQVKKAEEDLKREWGAAYNQNLNVAKMTAKKFGLTEEAADAIESVAGFGGVMKFLHGIGSATGEHGFAGGESGSSGILTPNAARAKIEELKNDPEFSARYLAGESKAVNEMTNLHLMMAGKTSK